MYPIAWEWALSSDSPRLLCSTSRVAFQNRSIAPQLPDSFLTGSSKLATCRRFSPKTAKNSFQKVWRSAFSRDSSAQSLAKATALWRISF
jgi:hypothetical protein